MKIKIAIAEDNIFLLKSLKEKIEFFDEIELKFAAENGESLINKVEEKHNIDLILMDIQMPVMDGIKATEIIKQKYPHIKIMMLTVFDDDKNVFKAIQAGADGYLLKDTKAGELEKAIKDTIEGGAAMTSGIALKALELLRSPQKVEQINNSETQSEITLTKRETEILIHISKGLDYKKIAKNLFISPATVRKHTENIYKKLKVGNKIQALEAARKNNLIG